MQYEKQFATVSGRKMAYIEVGEGDPIVFLHGNPSSSYLWRNIIPHVAEQGRVIAPDLIGMGDSEKLPGTGDERYRFIEHRAYLDALLEQLGVEREVVFVVHDWGSALGFDWIRRHPDAVAGVAYMEAIVQPFSWATFGEASDFFRGLRSPAGKEMALKGNAFVEGMLPAGIIRDLTEEEMAEFRRPFANPGEDRRPTLTWPREVAMDGEPADVHRIVEDYAAFMAGTEIPKLFINGEPGLALIDDARAFARAWKNQTEVTVSGLHFLQEDSPDEIGAALSEWIAGLSRTGSNPMVEGRAA